MVGSIGPAARREYTIISDAVNVTSRLEELNKRIGSAMIVTESVLAAGGELPDGFVGPKEVELRGHHGRMQVYYLPS
jgi:class 3 adenylate cyclase